MLFRAIVFQPSAPILIADDDRNYREVSAGAARLLGLPREKIIGRSLDDFTEAGFKPVIAERWRTFLDEGEQEGTIPLLGTEGSLQHIEYLAKGNVGPVTHLLVLKKGLAQQDKRSADGNLPAVVEDYGLSLLDASGRIVSWYAGAERIYGYRGSDVAGRLVSLVYPDDETPGKLQDELKRAAFEGHAGWEGWHVKKDGTRFWANVINMAIKKQNGDLQGFARVVRDFSNRRQSAEKLRLIRTRPGQQPAETSIAGIVSGEFDRLLEANDSFLNMLGYTRDDLQAGLLRWPDLTPPEYAALDELAHEEELRFGACTPFVKELIRRDGVRVPVLVATSILNLSPFGWITFVQDLRERRRLESVVADVAEVHDSFEEIVGSSPAIRRVMGQIEVVAPTDATVLILGETGTGKELVARAVHRLSARRNRPFIVLNCAAIPAGLLESELFGYERGAFSGALHQKLGRFELANKGTLFLDEVGDIPLDLQPKLLRALQERSLERLGGTRTIPIDVRLVVATNRNLAQMMTQKLFRSDLYYRIKVFPITTPPLRDRPGDIPELARHFTRKYSAKMNRTVERIPSETMRALMNWRWPGNIRELENFIERSVILSPGPSLRAPVTELAVGGDLEANLDSTLEDVERDHILRVFREAGGVVSATAIRLGLPRTTLNAMMKKLGISRGDL